MKNNRQFTAIFGQEGDEHDTLLPELDIASQGITVDEARNNLREAIELFLECADPSEIESRIHTEFIVD
jgi:predicted RNase H-like HicB family nuclease